MSDINTLPIQPKKALFELTMLNAESADLNFDDVIIKAAKQNIPPEVLTRLSELWAMTKLVAGEVVAIGKIIVINIIKFLIDNPGLTIGIALGAAVTALIAGIPLIGPILAPLAAVITILYGAGVGAAMQNGDHSMSPITAAIALAKKFFELLMMIFNGIKEYWKD